MGLKPKCITTYMRLNSKEHVIMKMSYFMDGV